MLTRSISDLLYMHQWRLTLSNLHTSHFEFPFEGIEFILLSRPDELTKKIIFTCFIYFFVNFTSLHISGKLIRRILFSSKVCIYLHYSCFFIENFYIVISQITWQINRNLELLNLRLFSRKYAFIWNVILFFVNNISHK